MDLNILNIEKQLMELVESVENYLSKISNGCIKIADFLRNEEQDKAYNSISDFIEGMEWFISSISILKNNNYSILFSEQELNLLLLELNGAIAQGDQNFVADLFEYEIATFFEENQLKIEKSMNL